eukprot:gene1016-606_t
MGIAMRADGLQPAPIPCQGWRQGGYKVLTPSLLCLSFPFPQGDEQSKINFNNNQFEHGVLCLAGVETLRREASFLNDVSLVPGLALTLTLAFPLYQAFDPSVRYHRSSGACDHRHRKDKRLRLLARLPPRDTSKDSIRQSIHLHALWSPSNISLLANSCYHLVAQSRYNSENDNSALVRVLCSARIPFQLAIITLVGYLAQQLEYHYFILFYFTRHDLLRLLNFRLAHTSEVTPTGASHGHPRASHMARSRRRETVKTSKLKTLLCTYVDKPEGCQYGDKCAFAHSLEELRSEVAAPSATPGRPGSAAPGSDSSAVAAMRDSPTTGEAELNAHLPFLSINNLRVNPPTSAAGAGCAGLETHSATATPFGLLAGHPFPQAFYPPQPQPSAPPRMSPAAAQDGSGVGPHSVVKTTWRPSSRTGGARDEHLPLRSVAGSLFHHDAAQHSFMHSLFAPSSYVLVADPSNPNATADSSPRAGHSPPGPRRGRHRPQPLDFYPLAYRDWAAAMKPRRAAVRLPANGPPAGSSSGQAAAEETPAATRAARNRVRPCKVVLGTAVEKPKRRRIVTNQHQSSCRDIRSPVESAETELFRTKGGGLLSNKLRAPNPAEAETVEKYTYDANNFEARAPSTTMASSRIYLVSAAPPLRSSSILVCWRKLWMVSSGLLSTRCTLSILSPFRSPYGAVPLPSPPLLSLGLHARHARMPRAMEGVDEFATPLALNLYITGTFCGVASPFWSSPETSPAHECNPAWREAVAVCCCRGQLLLLLLLMPLKGEKKAARVWCGYGGGAYRFSASAAQHKRAPRWALSAVNDTTTSLCAEGPLPLALTWEEAVKLMLISLWSFYVFISIFNQTGFFSLFLCLFTLDFRPSPLEGCVMRGCPPQPLCSSHPLSPPPPSAKPGVAPTQL